MRIMQIKQKYYLPYANIIRVLASVAVITNHALMSIVGNYTSVDKVTWWFCNILQSSSF